MGRGGGGGLKSKFGQGHRGIRTSVEILLLMLLLLLLLLLLLMRLLLLLMLLSQLQRVYAWWSRGHSQKLSPCRFSRMLHSRR